MDLNVLLQALGYLRSERHWVMLEAADPRLAHHYRLAQRAGEEAGEGAKVVGSYVYQTSLKLVFDSQYKKCGGARMFNMRQPIAILINASLLLGSPS